MLGLTTQAEVAIRDEIIRVLNEKIVELCDSNQRKDLVIERQRKTICALQDFVIDLDDSRDVLREKLK